MRWWPSRRRTCVRLERQACLHPRRTACAGKRLAAVCRDPAYPVAKQKARGPLNLGASYEQEGRSGQRRGGGGPNADQGCCRPLSGRRHYGTRLVGAALKPAQAARAGLASPAVARSLRSGRAKYRDRSCRGIPRRPADRLTAAPKRDRRYGERNPRKRRISSPKAATTAGIGPASSQRTTAVPRMVSEEG